MNEKHAIRANGRGTTLDQIWVRCRIAWRRLIRACDRWLNPVRVRRYPLLLLIGCMVSYAASLIAGDFPFDSFGSPFATDFSAQSTAGRIALDGEIRQIYDIHYQRAVQQEILAHRAPGYLNIFISPPIAAFLYAPFATLSYFPAALAWTLLSAGLLLIGLRVLWPLLPGIRQFGFTRVLLIAFSAPPVFECLQTGQDSLVSLLLLSLAVRTLVTRNEFGAGVAIGLGMFKPQLFILFPVLLLAQRRWRAFGAFAAVCSTLAATSIALIGFDGVRQ